MKMFSMSLHHAPPFFPPKNTHSNLLKVSKSEVQHRHLEAQRIRRQCDQSEARLQRNWWSSWDPGLLCLWRRPEVSPPCLCSCKGFCTQSSLSWPVPSHFVISYMVPQGSDSDCPAAHPPTANTRPLAHISGRGNLVVWMLPYFFK